MNMKHNLIGRQCICINQDLALGIQLLQFPDMHLRNNQGAKTNSIDIEEMLKDIYKPHMMTGSWEST